MTAATATEDAPTAPRWGALLAVLGVVYGDIGTSPLYAFKASLHPVPRHPHLERGDHGHPVADLLVARC